jgi:hypothetical protein
MCGFSPDSSWAIKLSIEIVHDVLAIGGGWVCGYDEALYSISGFFIQIRSLMRWELDF